MAKHRKCGVFSFPLSDSEDVDAHETEIYPGEREREPRRESVDRDREEQKVALFSLLGNLDLLSLGCHAVIPL